MGMHSVDVHMGEGTSQTFIYESESCKHLNTLLETVRLTKKLYILVEDIYMNEIMAEVVDDALEGKELKALDAVDQLRFDMEILVQEHLKKKLDIDKPTEVTVIK